MVTKMGGKMIFGKKVPDDSTDTLGVKNFVEIALSRTVSEINAFLRFTQKFKMATKNDGKTIFGKKCQITLVIPRGVKNLLKSLYLVLFLR